MKRDRLFVALAFVLISSVWAYAQTIPTLGEKSVGTNNCTFGNTGVDFDTISQCNSLTSTPGTMQKAPLFVGKVTSPPYANTDCDSSKAGLLQYSGTHFYGCNGTTWMELSSTAVTLISIPNFTDVMGVVVGSTISSNAVVPTGLPAGYTAVVCGAGCTNIAINGTWKNTTSTNMVAGDTLAIQQVASSSASTATTAVVTVGSASSTPWSVTTSANQPNSFTFTDQTGLVVGSTATSNTVVLTGTFTGLSASCSNCTAIARNGTWYGTTATGFVTGDTIAVKQIASSLANTATTTTVTVGTTIATPWSVTTSNNTPNAFSFTDQTGAAFNTTATSNAVTLTGTFSGLSASCTGCTGIARNGTWYGTTATGFVTGDTIAISLATSATASTAKTATVTVGTTTSGTWSVTTGTDACSGSPSIGTVCADGTVYAGLSPDGNVPMYTTACDLGQTGTKGSCTGTRSTYMWGTYGVTTGYTSTTTGKSNTANLIANYGSYNDGYTTGVPAAQACKNLTTGGHSDWYLPAKDELNVLYTNKATTGNTFLTDGSYYWSSTEYTSGGAWFERFSDGFQFNLNKSNYYYVRCVRR